MEFSLTSQLTTHKVFHTLERQKRATHLHDLLLVVPELRGVGHVLVGHPDHVGGDPPHRHPEHDEQLDHVAGLQGVHADELRTVRDRFR